MKSQFWAHHDSPQFSSQFMNRLNSGNRPVNGSTIIKALDTNGDDAVNFEEFIEAFNFDSVEDDSATRNKLWDHFKGLDLNNDNRLVSNEIERQT